MKWLVLSVIIVALHLQIVECYWHRGSCSSIGYSDRCCPPSTPNDREDNCLAKDGGDDPCGCDMQCHMYKDCCIDHACVAEPRTCGDTGITECCTDQSGLNPGLCDVVCYRRHAREDLVVCSCNASCHRRNDCCSDINNISCPLPQNCSAAGKDPGCCKSTDCRSSCHVPAGECYCDSQCVINGDCCNDVPLQCRVYLNDVSVTKPSIRKNLCKSVQTQSYLEQDLQALYAQQQYPPQRPPTHSEYDNHRMALAARIETMHTNAKEFRGRAKSHVAARPPAQYNYDYNY